MIRKVLLFLLCLSFSIAGSFATGVAEVEEKKGPIVVASKFDTEGSLLGSMIVLLLEDNGFEVVDKTSFGPTDVVRKAIISGEIDMYPEYTGNTFWFHGESDAAPFKNAATAYARAKELEKAAYDIEWLSPAGANNTWAIAIRKDLGNGSIKTMEDFADFVNAGGQVKLAGSEEFVSSEAALPSFEEAYGFKLEKEQLLVLSSGNTALTEKAAGEGTDGVNAAMAYGTDGNLAAYGLHVLEDTLGVQPVYEPAPIVRGAVFAMYPEIADILNPVFEKLDLVTLQTLNAKIAVEGQDASQVASQYLKEQGILK